MKDAKIIAYTGETGVEYVGIRTARGENFAVMGANGVVRGSYSEAGIAMTARLRVLESFPTPTLADIVGEAEAFMLMSGEGNVRAAQRSVMGRNGESAWFVAGYHRTESYTLSEVEYMLQPDLDSIITWEEKHDR